MAPNRSAWKDSRFLATIASASRLVKNLMPYWVLKWNLTQTRSFRALMKE